MRPVSYGQRLSHTKVKSDLVELENAQVLNRRLQIILWGGFGAHTPFKPCSLLTPSAFHALELK